MDAYAQRRFFGERPVTNLLTASLDNYREWASNLDNIV